MVRDSILRDLARVLDLEVHATKRRGHATHIAAGAVHEGFELIFALGGDGTANEVMQALAGTDTTLGIIPGGGANVLARALGLPNDPSAATAALLDHLANDAVRTIGLGRANGRYFGFNAGLGFDAAVVRRVEQRALAKRLLRQASFVWAATHEWLLGPVRRDPTIRLVTGTGATGPFPIVLVANASPYTFLGPRPFHATPAASFDAGLDVLTIGDVTTIGLLRIIVGALGGGRHLEQPGIGYHRDLTAFELRSQAPAPLMVDGEYAGEHVTVRFEGVPSALRVLAPPV